MEIYVSRRPTVNIFSEDTLLFSVATDPFICTRNLKSDLGRIAEWAHQWKMSFIPDPNKQAVEVCFSTKSNLPKLSFNGIEISSKYVNKHLGLFIDKKLTFDHHLKEKISKVNKGIVLTTRPRNYVPRHALIPIYKAFIIFYHWCGFCFEAAFQI